MNSYVALLRGIGPMNPNMRPAKLREAFEQMGFQNVRTVISSGNVIFESNAKSNSALESKIEQALPELLGFSPTTIVRSRGEIQSIIDQDPFKGVDHTPKTNLNVTFLKTPRPVNFEFPYTPPGRDYQLTGMCEGAICSVIDITAAKTPDLMTWLEKQFGKDITTRTYKTLVRILAKFDSK